MDLLKGDVKVIVLLLIGIILILLAVLLFVIYHRKHLRTIEERLDANPVDNEQHLKDVMRAENAATRSHLSHVVDSIRNDTKFTKERMTDFIADQKRDNHEFRGQLTIQKTRLKWVMSEIDVLSKALRNIASRIHDWFNPKPPEAP